MSEIVIPDLPHSICLEQLREALCDIVGLDQITNLIDTYILKIAALNTVLPDLDGRIRQITEALEAEVIPFPGSGMSLGDIDRRLAELEVQFQKLLEKAADDPIAYGDQFKEILDEQTSLKELRAAILAENKEHAEADRRIRDAAGMLENAVPHIAEWDETAIRQLVAQVKVLSKNEISVTLKSGIEIRQSISN